MPTYRITFTDGREPHLVDGDEVTVETTGAVIVTPDVLVVGRPRRIVARRYNAIDRVAEVTEEPEVWPPRLPARPTDRPRDTHPWEEPMPDLLKALIRTVIPGLVGLLVAPFTTLHLSVSEATLTTAATTALTAFYYAAARYAEARDLRLGWLLGQHGAPS